MVENKDLTNVELETVAGGSTYHEKAIACENAFNDCMLVFNNYDGKLSTNSSFQSYKTIINNLFNVFDRISYQQAYNQVNNFANTLVMDSQQKGDPVFDSFMSDFTAAVFALEFELRQLCG